MNRILYLVPVILLILSGSCSKKPTPQKFGDITGKVCATGTDLPLSYALVSCSGITDTTDANGAFSLSNIPVGIRTLTASKAGYEPYSASVDVREGHNSLDIQMKSLMATMGEITFFSERGGSPQLFVMDLDGSNQQQLTNLSLPEGWETSRDPLWSPDKERIAFIASLKQGSYDLMLINADGTDLDTLVSLEPARLGDWSSSGNQIVYGGRLPFHAPSPAFDIYLINSDGSDKKVLAGPAGLPRFCGSDRVVYVAWPAGTTPGDIFAITTDGSGEEQLTDSAIAGVSDYYMPVASPDGRKIAFGVDLIIDCIHYALGVMNSDGSGDTLLTWSCCSYRGISDIEYSPDGQKILFLANNGDASEVYVINVDGSGLAGLTGGIACERKGARWSPDGNWIVFTSNIGGNNDIYKVSVDGGKTLMQLTSDPADDSNPDW